MIDYLIYNGNGRITYGLKNGTEKSTDIDSDFAEALASLFFEWSSRPHLTVTVRQVNIDNPYFFGVEQPWEMLFHDNIMDSVDPW